MGIDWLTRTGAEPSGTGDRGARLARRGAAGRARVAIVAALAILACGQALIESASLASVTRVGPAVGPGPRGVAAGPDSAQVVLTALALCLLALAAVVALAILRPLWAAVSASAVSLITLLWFPDATVAGVIATLLAAYRLGATPPAPGPAGPGAGRRWLQGPYVAVALGLPFLLLALASRDISAMLLASGIPVAAGAGIAVRAGRSASGEDEARTVLTHTLTEHLARGERARIVRELHDVVAHHISMVAVRAETARLTTPGMPPAGAARLLEIGDTARAGLAEMRRLLGVLREDVSADEVAVRQPQPGLPQVAGLVDEARGAGGAAVRLIVSGAVAAFDPGVELVAYRIVQEALTNARRHAPGAAVDVELEYEQDVLRLRIRDNGPGPAAPGREPGDKRPGLPDGDRGPSGGHGLLGMRERAATVGGSVHTGAAPGGGFLVEAVLPVRPDGMTS
ncbi:MAG TPA: sensor histidine kinase [Trebonia sp.]|nr:sensor histidine kinase [Trebonia sp.]